VLTGPLRVSDFLYGFLFGCCPYFPDYRWRRFSFALCPGLPIRLSRRSCTSTAHLLYPSTISPKTGFVNDEPALRRLPDSYYEPWEAIGESLPELIRTVGIREKVKQLPVLSTSKLRSEAEWRRAYVLLSYITQGYI